MPRSSTHPSRRTSFWRELIARQAASRLSVEQYCQQAGVSTASFYAWRKRLSSSPEPAHTARRSQPSRPTLVPLQIVGGSSITIELAQPLRIIVPPGCDEASLRVALRAALDAAEGRSPC